MKYIIVFLSLIATAALADTYKWEDKDGVHFTENLSSVPKKYRSKAEAEARGDITTRDPEIRDSIDHANARAKVLHKEEERKTAQNKPKLEPIKKKEPKGAMHQFNDTWLKSR